MCALLQNSCRNTAECVLSTAGYIFEYCKMCDSTTEYISKYCRICRSTVECVSSITKYVSEHCRLCVEVLQNRLWTTAECVSEYCRMRVGVQKNTCHVLQSMFQSTAE
jgi:hypothetical protein